MKITKYEHACLTIEIANRILVIDPGIYSDSFKPSNNIDIVVVTHEHSDHFDPEKISAIQALNPNVVIFTTDDVAPKIPEARVPNTGEKITVGNFTLEFFGSRHASIIDGIVPCKNFGVIVNDVLVYPGDSFEIPPLRPQILAVPASAPWLKIAESVDYVAKTKPTQIFPTHNALLSEIGENITYAWLKMAAEKVGAEFVNLKTGNSVEI
jgi:L-ascorbate metabolism protein UlaG (beta-lactamase superfamily)